MPAPCLCGSGVVRSSGPHGAALHDHGPKATASATGTDDGSHSGTATGPSPEGPGHFPHPGHPWPAKGGNQINGAWRSRRPQRPTQRHPRNQPGCACNPGTLVWIKHRSPLHEAKHSPRCTGCDGCRRRVRRWRAKWAWALGSLASSRRAGRPWRDRHSFPGAHCAGVPGEGGRSATLSQRPDCPPDTS
jgi:hypothetical protein